MGVLRSADAMDLARDGAKRQFFRSDAETAIRDLVEDFLRERNDGVRIIHELNMCQGGARADVVAVGQHHLAAVEIKGPWDNTDRVIGQLAAFRMAMPELWLFCAGYNVRDIDIVRYLFPTVGLAEVVHADQGPSRPEVWADEAYRFAWGGNKGTVEREKLSIRIIHPAEIVAPLDRALLNILWVEELRNEAVRASVWQGKGGTHAKLIGALMPLGNTEKIEAVCRQLRQRPTAHRADPAPPPDAREG